MNERPYDERLDALGHAIWDRVVRIESFHVAMRHGTSMLRADAEQMVKTEEQALWGDLQTLFRGGVFPEDLPKMVYDPSTDSWSEA